MRQALAHWLPILTISIMLLGSSPVWSTEGNAPVSPEQAAAWRADLAHLSQQLPALHFNLFHQMREDEFTAAVNQLHNDIPQLAPHEITIRLAQLVAMAGDGHTTLGMQRAGFHIYPVLAWWFADGPYVIQTTREHEALLGKRLTAIGGMPVAEAVERVGTTLAWENDSQLLKELPLRLVQAEALHALSVAQSPAEVSFTVVDQNGAETTENVSAIKFSPSLDWVTTGPGIPGLTAPRGPNYRYLWNPDTGVLLLEYNLCMEREDISFAEFEQLFLDALEEYDWQRVAIDLRFNGGGNSGILDPLIAKLAAMSAINKRGRLYVLTGRATFSSAVLNAMRLRNDTEAILIGEPTGGRPNHYGEIQSFELPNSKLTVQYSSNYFVTIDYSDPDSIYPDIEVMQTFADYLAGTDTVLELVRDGALPGG